MKNDQNDIFLNSQIAQFYDTPEQRQLLSNYNAPSICPLVNYQLQIHHNFAQDDHLSAQIDSPEEWSILSHLTKSIDIDRARIISETVDINSEKSLKNALEDINIRIDLIQKKG